MSDTFLRCCAQQLSYMSLLLQVGLLLFGLGLPVVAGLLLWHNRKRLDDWDFVWKVRNNAQGAVAPLLGVLHSSMCAWQTKLHSNFVCLGADLVCS
jgi:hypothetical protein